MMLDSFGSGRVYYFDPASHEKYKQKLEDQPEFPDVVYLEFEEGFVDEWSAETIAELFSEFGDFFV